MTQMRSFHHLATVNVVPVLVGGLLVRRLHPVDNVGDLVRRPRVVSDSLRRGVAPEALLVLLGRICFHEIEMR
jgi:hypothetical protein